MPPLVREEPSGNVVLASGKTQLRHFLSQGGAPAEFWQYGAPGPITNSFAGSSVSINFETGQDPTQAGANGFTPYVLSRIDRPGDRFYLRETLFDAINGVYGIQGYFPDFWASIEAIDDYNPARDFPSKGGWRTRYFPGTFGADLAALDFPVIFQPSAQDTSGIFAVGNEMTGPALRPYRDGWIALKMNLSMLNATPGSLAGVLLQKTIASLQPTKDEMFNAAGLHFIFNGNGVWELSRWAPGVGAISIATGQLNAIQLSKFRSNPGLPIEVRTHPGIVGYLELFLDNAPTPAKVIPDTGLVPARETWFGLFAQGTTGHMRFAMRQAFDLNAKVISYYFVLPGDKVLSHQTIISNDLSFYRANMPGVFLNPTLFPLSQRFCGVIGHDGQYTPHEGHVDIPAVRSIWAGNQAGTLGILATVKKVDIDGAAGTDAHALVSKKAHNDEFVLMLNPFSVNWNNSPQVVRRVTMVTEWSTKRV